MGTLSVWDGNLRKATPDMTDVALVFISYLPKVLDAISMWPIDVPFDNSFVGQYVQVIELFVSYPSIM